MKNYSSNLNFTTKVVYQVLLEMYLLIPLGDAPNQRELDTSCGMRHIYIYIVPPVSDIDLKNHDH